MALPRPKLDDRTFQDLVDEAKRKISEKCPQWTDHNVSDPGIALIEIFAWMTDLLIYRINQVPEKNYIAFLNLLGIQREPPRPARGEIVFNFVTHHPVCTVPKGTQVATKREGGADEIVFTTDEDGHVKENEEKITVPIAQAQYVQNENLNLDEGPPFRLNHRPILAPAADEIIEIETEKDKWDPWTSLIGHLPRPDDPPAHAGGEEGRDPEKLYVLDPLEGEVSFPFHAPPAGKRIRMRAYRVGGGVMGNVSEGQITVCKTAIPYVQSVNNPKACTGGRDAGTLEEAKRAAAGLLQTRDRAVTASDFEFLAQQVRGVGRARCFPGKDRFKVDLRIVPSTLYRDADRIDVQDMPAYIDLLRKYTFNEKPEGDWGTDVNRDGLVDIFDIKDLIPDLQSFLEPRFIIPMMKDDLSITRPDYVFAALDLEVTAERGVDLDRLKQSIQEELCRFLHPLLGGPQEIGGSRQNGWSFGRVLMEGIFFPLVYGIPGVENVVSLKLCKLEPRDTLWKFERPDDRQIQSRPTEVIAPAYSRIS